MNFIISLLCLSSLVWVPVIGGTHPQSIPLPHNVLIPYGVQPGWSVTIAGFVVPHAINFTMDFECAPSNDIAFHLKPYFINTEVVRNNRLNMNWGNGDISGINPLKRSQPFQVKVTVENSGYKVDMNNNHFCHYQHYIPIHRITNLLIFGDIILTSIVVE